MRSHHETSNQTRVTCNHVYSLVLALQLVYLVYTRENKCTHTLRTREYVGLHLEN